MTDQLQSIDIASVLRQKGPIVSCVILRATSAHDQHSKPAAAEETLNSCDHLVEEIQIDTTPKMNSVEKILGGPFTFVGQYEEEGIMVMARNGFEEEEETGLLLNPHKLQPPFNDTKIHGDILLLKVAECDDPLDGSDASEKEPVVNMASNDEFFLNYTKEEYLKFAARTDVVPPVPPEEEDEEEDCADENSGEDEEEGEWSGEEGEDEEDEEEMSEEEAQSAMMNLLMANVLRKFQEENGRGPSTEELQILKMTIAQKLGIPMGSHEGDEEESEEHAQEQESNTDNHDADASQAKTEAEGEESKKRGADDAESEACEPMQKKVKFGPEETNEKAVTVLAH